MHKDIRNASFGLSFCTPRYLRWYYGVAANTSDVSILPWFGFGVAMGNP